MNDFFPEKWERIKILASRLQAIRNILDFFDNELEERPFAAELEPIRGQLENDFEQTLESLLELIDDEDSEIN